MSTTYSLDELKKYHNESIKFFGSELMLLKEAIPKISDDRQGKVATLLISGGQTGAAIIKLSDEIECFDSEIIMLTRAFIENMVNFCYACICDEKEYRRFILHPIYKHYHNVGNFKIEDGFRIEDIDKKISICENKQKELKKKSIVQEALELFSETKEHLKWTNKTLTEKIKAIEKWGKIMDVFFTIAELEYYSNASEALHGSLYGSIYNLGVYDPKIDYKKNKEFDKKLYKSNACILLQIGILIHECLTLLSYSNDINEIYESSYQNRTEALNFLSYILEETPKS